MVVMAVVLGSVAIFAVPARPVSVAPMAVYIDDSSRSGALTLFNPGTKTEEIRIDFAFGYPQTNANGEIIVPITETAPPGEPSALPWLSAFPQRLRLGPGERQVVRLIARPPPDIETGEYWARVLVHAEGGQQPIESNEAGVAVQIDINTVVVVAVNYRNGEMTTGLSIEDASATLVGDSLVHEFRVRRTGNAAYLGRVVIEAFDRSGDVVLEFDDILPVYTTMYRRIPVAAPSDSVATIRYTFETRRDDLPPEGPLPTEPIVREVPVR